MKQCVYIDVLIVLNVFVNYFLLLATSFISNEKTNRLRLLLGSVLGGIYSLILIFPSLHIMLSITVKLLFSITIILASFKIKNIKHFLRLFAIFFGVNFVFAGIMFAIWMVIKPNGMQFNNGAVYFEINALMLTILTVICYLIITLISKLSRKNAPHNKLIDIIVEFENKQISGRALIDTGNSLIDSFSGNPVVVAELDFIKKILPQKLLEFMSNPDSIDVQNLNDEYKGIIRFIPFNSIGGNGLLKAIRCDVILIYKNERIEKKSVYVAVKNISLSNGEYVAIVNPKMIDEFLKEAAIK